MTRRKIMMILSFLVLLIFISGFSCSVSNPLSKKSGTDTKTAKKAAEDLRTGTEGVTAAFMANNPPDTIHVEPSLPNIVDVIVELSNRGVYPQIEEGRLLSGKIFLSGYDQNILTFEPKVYDLSKKALNGKSLVDIKGGTDIVIFNGKVNLDNLKVEKYDPTLMATVCYNYQTIAGPSVCIDPDPFSTVKQKKVCEAGPVTLTSQGAPIAIVSVDEEAFATKTQFKINIRNVGGGEVLRTKGTAAANTQPQASGSNDDTINKCDPFGPLTNKLTREDIDKVYLEEVSLGLTPLPCWPFTDKSTKEQQGLIRLINGEGSVICELSKTSEQGYPGGNTAYTAPMKIILSYGYKVTTERKVLIKKENIGKT